MQMEIDMRSSSVLIMAFEFLIAVGFEIQPHSCIL